jgi:hypothetical protein
MGAGVINLDRLRRDRDEAARSHARVLVDDFVESMDCVPAVAAHLAWALGVILQAVRDDNVDAERAWKRIEREMIAPIRAHEPGEHACQPLIDRVVTVVALAAHYRMTQQWSPTAT